MNGLRSEIETSFNLDEIATICADIGIDFENLAGVTKTAKSRELILHCVRKASLSSLIELIARLRPAVNWSKYLVTLPVASQNAELATALQPLTDWEPIRLLDIVHEEVTSPRNDGTRGSGLYAVPVRLSRSPDTEWSRLFVAHWNSPPRFSTMHRPGIARVTGDKVILDGTTLEEIERFHAATLKLVLQETNRDYQKRLEQAKSESEQREQDEQARKSDISERAKRIRFD